MLLAALGLYAWRRFSVERRTQELGIRAALGASVSPIMRMVVGQSLATVLLGIVAGLALAFVTVRGTQGMIFGVGAADPATFVTASVLLLAAATVAGSSARVRQRGRILSGAAKPVIAGAEPRQPRCPGFVSSRSDQTRGA